MSRVARPWGPLDQLLEQCRGHRLLYRWCDADLTVWELGCCPACRSPGWDIVRVREGKRGGEISILSRCCDAQEIRAALAADPLRVRIGELEGELADALAIAERCRDVAGDALAIAEARSREAVAA